VAWDWTRTSPQWAMARPNPSSETDSHSASQENLRMQRKIWVFFVIAGACHGTQCGVKCIQSTSSHLISLIITLLLSFHSFFGQRSNYCYSDFQKKKHFMHSLSISFLLHVPPFFPLVITCLFGKKLWNTLQTFIYSFVIFCPLYSNTFTSM